MAIIIKNYKGKIYYKVGHDEKIKENAIYTGNGTVKPFKQMIDDETKKCEKITGGSDFLKCKILATSYAVKQFLYKYGNASDEVVEMVQETLRQLKKDP